MALFGGGARDRAQLVETLTSLGPSTSVQDLSAALAWPPRRTIRTLQSLAHSGGQVAYDPSTGAVRAEGIARSVLTRSDPQPASGNASTPSPAIIEAGDVPRPGPCPICRTPMSATGTPGNFYCSRCGNLETHSVPPPLGSSRAAPATGIGVRREGGLDDRQAQELFAAWVTSQPIPCPRCRQPLAHRGVQTYACPACGERVTFADSGVAEANAPTA
jgi:predicted RNA-binding Zn-ribbon protein involved in translation (DUF1610 family)